ncbi:MAG: NACHT domain-containing protein [Flavisolibacter sp.]|nr:NACHT domain-containing protein [Flavisolibacter sp.]
MIKEEFENTTISESAKSLFQLAWSIISKLGKKGVDRIKVQKAISSYAENYLKRHGQVKVLGMSEPVPLLDIYTSVKIVSPLYLVKEQNIQNLESSFRQTREHFGPDNRKSAVGIANEIKQLNILGAPGSGKSTFLKRIGLEAMLEIENNDSKKERYIHDCIPVLIELKRFKNEKIDIKALIQKEFEIAGFPESEAFVKNALKNGKLLILLDGLDEVPQNILAETIEHIKDFTDTFDKNRFITSCRTAFYKTYLKGFSDYEIASFDDIQIQKFINNWFRLEQDRLAGTAERLIKLLFDKSNAPSLEIARTPLLLAFLCLTFDESQRFPSNRSSLYRRALLILVEKWAAEKRIHNDDIYQDLTSEIEIEMLSEMAAKFFLEDKRFFFQTEVKQSIKTFLESSLNVRATQISKILEAIEIQQGILVQRAPEIYSFSHLTIQEYLTAHYYNSPTKVTKLIEEHLFDQTWREVFLLLAGMSNADDLMVLMVEFLKDFAKKNIIIKECIDWIESILPVSGRIEIDASRRIFLVSLILRFKRYDNHGYGSAIRLESYAIELIDLVNRTFFNSVKMKGNINKEQAIQLLHFLTTWDLKIEDIDSYIKEIRSIVLDTPQHKMLHGSRSKYHKKILGPFYSAIKVPNDLGFRKRNNYEPLLKYLEAYCLVIYCKDSALRVSKGIWNRTIESILSY